MTAVVLTEPAVKTAMISSPGYLESHRSRTKSKRTTWLLSAAAAAAAFVVVVVVVVVVVSLSIKGEKQVLRKLSREIRSLLQHGSQNYENGSSRTRKRMNHLLWYPNGEFFSTSFTRSICLCHTVLIPFSCYACCSIFLGKQVILITSPGDKAKNPGDSRESSKSTLSRTDTRTQSRWSLRIFSGLYL